MARDRAAEQRVLLAAIARAQAFVEEASIAGIELPASLPSMITPPASSSAASFTTRG
jgi:hypothetical protein